MILVCSLISRGRSEGYSSLSYSKMTGVTTEKQGSEIMVTDLVTSLQSFVISMAGTTKSIVLVTGTHA
jgi:hypothetical protein